MKWLRIAYDTIWFKVHPITGPVHGVGATIYPTWRQAWTLAS